MIVISFMKVSLVRIGRRFRIELLLRSTERMEKRVTMVTMGFYTLKMVNNHGKL